MAGLGPVVAFVASLVAGSIAMAGTSDRNIPESQRVINGVQDFFEAVDAHDWSRAETRMSTPFHIDYSSLGAGPAADLQPSAILAGWRGILPGFDATHHQLGPLVVDIEGDRADVRAYATALHFLEGAVGGSVWRVVGTYNIGLIKMDDHWILGALTFNFRFQDGNINLPAMAQRRASEQAR